ncbi:MAG: recombination mediator protein UvsY [Gammaproteobacteria bacterium]|nr:recombination mediator protein UvsY [Gammaproteobacteria bacterium]
MTQVAAQQCGLNYWYNQICLEAKLDLIPDAVQYFEEQLKAAKAEISVKGNLEQASARLPGLFEYRYSQLQEIESIVEYLNIRLRKIRKERLEYYTTKYNKQLTVREAEKYVEGDDEYVDFSYLLNYFALVRNQFTGLIKSLDIKNWQISNITKLRAAGIEDASI